VVLIKFISRMQRKLMTSNLRNIISNPALSRRFHLECVIQLIDRSLYPLAITVIGEYAKPRAAALEFQNKFGCWLSQFATSRSVIEVY